MKCRPKPFELKDDDSCDRVISQLFGKNIDYRYALRLTQELTQPLYKERNFNLEVELVNADGHQISNSNSSLEVGNPIPLKLRVYTNDKKPLLLDSNKTGQPILKGISFSELFHGATAFTKMHLREVSSYYPDGIINLVVVPEAPSFSYNAKESSVEKEIDYALIKPLVVSVMVRAKRKHQEE